MTINTIHPKYIQLIEQLKIAKSIYNQILKNDHVQDLEIYKKLYQNASEALDDITAMVKIDRSEFELSFGKSTRMELDKFLIALESLFVQFHHKEIMSHCIEHENKTLLCLKEVMDEVTLLQNEKIVLAKWLSKIAGTLENLVREQKEYEALVAD